MAFIGKSPQAGNFIVLDSITTSATATYNLTRNSTAYFPVSARNLIVSLNGITQAPDTAYSVSGSTITFSSALTSSDVIDYILVLGDVGSIGTPGDNTVGESQLSYPLTNFSSTGIDDNATSTAVTIDSSQNTTFAGEVTVSKIISSTSGNIAAAFTSTTTTAKLTITDANDTAFIDVNATRLGIGHASSTSLQALQIEPTSAEAMRIDSNGSVGIGTTSPSSILTVNKDTGSTPTVYINNSGPDATEGVALKVQASGRGTGIADVSIFSVHNNTTELFTVRNDGNVGIGETNPSFPLEVNGGTGDGIKIKAGNTTNDDSFLVANSSDANLLKVDGVGNVFIYANGGELRFTGHSFYRPGALGSGIHLSTNRVLPANENGSVSDNTEDLGASTYRFKHLYLSGGVHLGGTGAANRLDDYEEGTWTPTTPNGSWTVNEATYTKIGRLVYVRARVTAINAVSGDFGGLPFTVSGNYTAGSVGYQNSVASEVFSLLVQSPTNYNFRIGNGQYGLAAGKQAMFSATYETT